MASPTPKDSPHKIAGIAAAILALPISLGFYFWSISKGTSPISLEGFGNFAVPMILLFLFFMYLFIGIAHIASWIGNKLASLGGHCPEQAKGRD